MPVSRIALVAVCIVLPIVVLIVATVVLHQPAWAIAITALPPWAYALLRVLYDWWDDFHFWISRTYIYWLNKEVDWELRAEYQDFESSAILVEIATYLKSEFPKAQFLVDEGDQKVIRLDGFPVRLRVTTESFSSQSYDTPTNFLIVDTMPMNHAFRRAQKLMNPILCLLEKIADKVNAAEQKYEMQIRFDGENPYFGFYVQRVKLPNVTRFQCEFTEQIGGYKQSVVVSEKGIAIVTDSIASLSTLAKEYLSLAPAPHGDLS